MGPMIFNSEINKLTDVTIFQNELCRQSFLRFDVNPHDSVVIHNAEVKCSLNKTFPRAAAAIFLSRHGDEDDDLRLALKPKNKGSKIAPDAIGNYFEIWSSAYKWLCWVQCALCVGKGYWNT